MMSGVCLLKGCTLRGNKASYGGALEVGHHACCCFCCQLGRVCAGWLLVAWPACAAPSRHASSVPQQVSLGTELNTVCVSVSRVLFFCR